MGERLLTLEELKGSLPMDTYINKRKYNYDTELLIANSDLIDGYFTGGEFLLIRYDLSVIETESGNLMPYIPKIISGERYTFEKKFYNLFSVSSYDYGYFKRRINMECNVEKLGEEELLRIINEYYEQLMISLCSEVHWPIKSGNIQDLSSISIKYIHNGRKSLNLNDGPDVYMNTRFPNEYNNERWDDSELKEYLGYERDYDGDIEFGDDYY